MKKSLVAIAASLLSVGAMALTVQIKVDMDSDTLYREVAKNTFQKSYSLVSGEARVIVIQDGNVLANQAQDINERDEASGINIIKVLDKSTVQIVDQEVGDDGHQTDINAVVQAKIKKSFTGRLKTISVSKAEYLALYKKELERAGLNQLRSLNIDTDELKLSTSIDISGLDCKAKDSNLNCAQNIEMTITASDDE
tara:strand:- start:36678 stop:37265 length:588 start_codon:yes stop_codon:yes gene_type:complete